MWRTVIIYLVSVKGSMSFTFLAVLQSNKGELICFRCSDYVYENEMDTALMYRGIMGSMIWDQVRKNYFRHF